MLRMVVNMMSRTGSKQLGKKKDFYCVWPKCQFTSRERHTVQDNDQTCGDIWSRGLDQE